MSTYLPVASVLAAVCALVAVTYVLALLVSEGPRAVAVEPFLSGAAQTEHATSRWHARWYAVTLVFLAFDMEMVFMYPWAVVMAAVGLKAVVEMFLFLGLLMSGVLYAWREGALRWA